MRTTILTTAIALAVAATSAAARNCKIGSLYCGRTLRTIGAHSRTFPLQYLANCMSLTGNYDHDIEIALSNAGLYGTGNDSLFECRDIFGHVTYIETCNGCVDGGQGNNDHC
ncbi:hypothetical protein FB451DRAFT_1299112 [Mycena latifolia]|nr:hypothetical protein FB451DRAFT_1299112 [Mycena latifolia]